MKEEFEDYYNDSICKFESMLKTNSFMFFDSGYNIISGNHPFKDYWLITGPLVDYIQSLFFLILGINWTSYVLHASTLNMALVLFSF